MVVRRIRENARELWWYCVVRKPLGRGSWRSVLSMLLWKGDIFSKEGPF